MTDAWSKPVVRTLVDQVATAVLQQISGGRLRPGQSLPPQRQLARELGVGLSAIREAIQRLQTLGILRTQQGRGTVVENLSWPQLIFEPSLAIVALERDILRDVCEARNAIEMETARLATLRARDESLAEIRAVLDEAGDVLATYDENQRLNKVFHMAIARASHNRVLPDVLAPLLEVEVGTMRKVYDGEMSRRSWEIHREIFAAIAARNRDAVAGAMRKHADELQLELEGLTKMLRPGSSPPDTTMLERDPDTSAGN